MTLTEAMSRLEAQGSERMREMNTKNGAGKNQFGVKMGDIRIIAKEIKIDPDLAKQLWDTENLDARFLSTLITRPKQLSQGEVEKMVRSVSFSNLADWVNTNILKVHPEKEAMRQKWMTSDHPSLLRAAWSLTAHRIAKDADGLDIVGLLDRIENEMADAHELPKWTMNYALAEIGINFPEQRKRALAIGEKLGVYRDYPTPKGCTSPFAPIWIQYFVDRQD